MQINRNKFLGISVIIYARNEEENLLRLFSSLKNVNYPPKDIEYIFIDDNSRDKSAIIAKDFGARIISVNTGDIELNKGIGLRKATKDLVYWLDADMEVTDKDFFIKMTKPFKDQRIIASFTNEFDTRLIKKIKNSILRFISYDPLQCDPLYQFFSIPIKKTIIKDLNDYYLCFFESSKIPPCGRSMYKRIELLKTKIGVLKTFIDLEALEIVVREKHNHFAYVPKAGICHYHALTLKALVGKRLRNLKTDYLPNSDHKYYLWINFKKPKEILRVIFWIIYANLFFPELIRGLFKTIRYKDRVFLWHPIISIVLTDSILMATIFNAQGRKFIKKVLTHNFST